MNNSTEKELRESLKFFAWYPTVDQGMTFPEAQAKARTLLSTPTPTPEQGVKDEAVTEEDFEYNRQAVKNMSEERDRLFSENQMLKGTLSSCPHFQGDSCNIK